MEENRLSAGGLSIGAYRVGDRWLLFIEGPTGHGPAPLWEMAPATKKDDDLDLENPIFQECHLQRDVGGGGKLLLVGQCRRRHFSGVLSVEAGKARFEVADRWTTPLPIKQIRVSGLLGSAAERIERKEGGCLLTGPGGAWSLTAHQPSSPTFAGFQWEPAGRKLSMRSYPTKSPLPPTTASYGFDLFEAP